MAEIVEEPRTISPPWLPYVVMFIGLLAVSTAAIFTRVAQGADAPSLVIAASRLCVASIILTPTAWGRYREDLRGISGTNLRLAVLSGLVLGLHFATWISSLEYTSVVNSVVLVTTNPLWVALLAPIFLGENLGRWTLIGLALALAGGILVALSGESGNPPTRPDHLLGNSLALTGAVAAAIYFIIGRKVRGGLAIIPYIWLVYTTAALTLVLVVLASGQQVLGLPVEAYLAMAMLGLFPQLIGHSSFNFALGFLPAAYVSLVVLGEPVGSGILAAIFLDEWPVPLQLLGALLIMTGIAAGTRDQLERKQKQAVEVEMAPDDSE